MNKYAIAAVGLTVVQAVLACGGIYAMVRSMRQFKSIVIEREEARVWGAWLVQLKWLAASTVLLLMCSFLQLNWSSSWRVVLMVGVAVFVFGLLLSIWMARRVRAIDDAEKVLPEGGGSGMVLIRGLQPDRVRGLSEDGKPLLLTAEDLRDFKAIKGFAQMINLQVALNYGVGGMTPVFRFVNDNGASLVLYADDDVVPA